MGAPASFRASAVPAATGAPMISPDATACVIGREEV